MDRRDTTPLCADCARAARSSQSRAGRRERPPARSRDLLQILRFFGTICVATPLEVADDVALELLRSSVRHLLGNVRRSVEVLDTHADRREHVRNVTWHLHVMQ